MSLTATTLSAAITAQDTYFALASVTNVTAPTPPTGAGNTWLLIGTELMFVEAVNTSTLVVNVLRGQAGTRATSHGATEPVVSGAYSDFPNFRPTTTADQVAPDTNRGFGAPVASAASITASGPLFHVSGGTAVNIIVPYTGFIEGAVTIVFDSTCTWTSSSVTNGIFASGTSTTGGSAVTFYYDAASARWYPSRLA